MVPKGSKMHMTYPFMFLVMGVGVPGPKQQNILHLGVPTNLQIPHMTLLVVPKSPRRHMANTFLSLVLVLWVIST